MDKPTKSQFKNFINELLSAALEGGEFDQEFIQNLAADNGLLEEVTATESCGADCLCKEYEFPVQCYRKLY